MTKIAVVSSCYGDYDSIHIPPEQTVDCEWVLVTDRTYSLPIWRVQVEPRPQLHPRMAAKVAKAHPEWYADADAYLWIDSNLSIKSSKFVEWATAPLKDEPLAMRRCRERQSLIGEADVARGMDKYKGVPVQEQAHYYTSHGYPDQWGLWWTGLMARRSDCRNFGDAWLAEQLRWTYEDQISIPWVFWNMVIRPADLPIEFPNPMFDITNHRSLF